jgi:hypothetical protein
MVVHALKEHDPVRRIRFCDWFLQSVLDGEVDPQLVFFSDEAWFSLRGKMNSQNNWYWYAENPRLFHEFPLHDKRIGVWCAISACRITGRISYNDTVNVARYVNNILSPFFIELIEEESLYSVFQQDSATAHNGVYKFGRTVGSFCDRIISHGLWLPHSPCDFYLWGSSKDNVYKTNSYTLE